MSIIKRFKHISLLFAAGLTLTLAACGGGGGGGTGGGGVPDPGPTTFTGISITPGNVTIPANVATQLTVNANFSDGTSINITAGALLVTDGGGAVTTGDLLTLVGVGGTVSTITAFVNANTFAAIANTPEGIALLAAVDVLGQELTATTTFTASSAAFKGAGADLRVTPNPVNLVAGQMQQLKVEGDFDDGQTYDLTLSSSFSSSTSSATVNAAGLVTASLSSTGSAIVTATYDVEFIATSTINVTADMLDTLTITPATLNVPGGLVVPITVMGHYTSGVSRDLTGDVSLNSTKFDVVNPGDGNVLSTGIPGTAEVTAIMYSAGAGGADVTATLNVTVNDATLTGVSVSPATASVPNGRTAQFVAQATYSDGSTHTLTRGDTTWGVTTGNTISPDGLVTAGTLGAVTVTASFGGKSGTATLTVTDAVLVEIYVGTAYFGAPLGLTDQYSAMGVFSDGSAPDITSTVKMISSNNTVAAVNAQGVVTAKAEGTAYITALDEASGIYGTSIFYASPAIITAITVEPATVDILTDLTQQFTATAALSDETSISPYNANWSSSASNVTIAPGGLATGVAATDMETPSVTITATESGECPTACITGEATITVTDALLVSLRVSVNPETDPASVVGGKTIPFTAWGTYNNDIEYPNAPVTWTTVLVEGEGVASIDNNTGVATGIEPGPVTIKATSTLDVTKTATAVLTVTPALLETITVGGTASAPMGRTTTLSATGAYTNGGGYTFTNLVWSTDGKTGFSVVDGVVTIASTVTVDTTSVITATEVGVTGYTGEIAGTLTVTALAPVLDSIEIAVTNSANVPVGTTEQLTAVGTGSDGGDFDLTGITITWGAEPKGGVIAVDASGLVTVPGTASPGTDTAIITASVGDVTSNTITITAGVAVVESFTIQGPADLTLAATGTYSVATALYSDGTTTPLPAVTWAVTSGTGTIDTNTGVLTATGTGAIAISATATLYTGVSAAASVMVYDAPTVTSTTGVGNTNVAFLHLMSVTDNSGKGIASYLWTLSDGVSDRSSRLAGSDTASLFFTPDTAGTWTGTITVTDNLGGVSTADVVVTVSDAPDLSVTIDRVETEPNWVNGNWNVKFYFTVTNNGTASSGTGWSVSIWSDSATEPVDTTGSFWTGTLGAVDIPAGGSYSNNWNASIFSTMKSGTGWMWVDSTGVVAESDELNNKQSIAWAVPSATYDGVNPEFSGFALGNLASKTFIISGATAATGVTVTPNGALEVGMTVFSSTGVPICIDTVPTATASVPITCPLSANDEIWVMVWHKANGDSTTTLELDVQ